ncbi:MAG: hypothetical protein GX921_00360, partial [Bacteroidales bacterium]|nr:hypothetical protein [Bacteroidales bacterium]
GAETIAFSETGTAIGSQNQISLNAPKIMLSGYMEDTQIDGYTMQNLSKQITYNFAYIINIVSKLASMGIIVDPPPQ